MKRIQFFFVIIASATLFLSGCASTPENTQADKTAPEQKLKVGMSKEEVRTLMGNPHSVATNSGGEVWEYTDNAKMFIPFYAIGGGKFNSFSLTFDADGKLKDWSTKKSSIY